MIRTIVVRKSLTARLSVVLSLFVTAAQAQSVPSPFWIVAQETAPAPGPALPSLREVLVRDALAHAPIASSSFSRATHDVRLSSGAKTAIIVGAIVGGILILAGVIALRKP